MTIEKLEIEVDEQKIDDVEIESGRLTIDDLNPPGQIRRKFEELKNGLTHPAPCCCPSCFYQLYVSRTGQRGRTFDKETFFLEYLYHWARLSNINVWHGYRFAQNGPSRGEEIYRYDFPDYFRTRGALAVLVKYLKKYFPKIDPDPRRIKLKIWRLRKSGIIRELEFARLKNASPPSSNYDEVWKDLSEAFRFAQRVAEFINAQPDQRATQREILWRLNKRIEDLERIHKVEDDEVIFSLLANFGIVSKRKGKSRLFISTRRKRR